VPRVLIFVDYFAPGFRFGGPIRSIGTMIDALADRFEFYVVTRPHDEERPSEIYEGIQPDAWNERPRARVFYASNFGPGLLRRIMCEIRPDFVYLSSHFSKRVLLVLALRRLGLLPPTRYIVAPHGELAQSALAIRSFKKRTFLLLSKFVGFHRKVHWHATSPQESLDIRTTHRLLGGDPHIAPNLIVLPDLDLAQAHVKQPDKLRLLLIARIAPIKNIDFLLRVLARINSTVELDIYGPIQSKYENYWHECSALIDQLPPHIEVKYHGPIQPSLITATAQRYDFFVLPTQSENFGYSIMEALAAGLPVVISDQTPWHDLAAANAGFDLPLQPDLWAQTLMEAAALGSEHHAGMRRGARRFAERAVLDPALIEASARLFS
jgi:glycosyltransferase involved in cell wall biosynthesis